MAAKQSTTVRILPALWARAEQEAAELQFASAAEIINGRLITSFEKDGPPVQSGESVERERKLKLENQKKEWELAKMRGELIAFADILPPIEDGMRQIRQHIETVWAELPGATFEQQAWLRDAAEEICTRIYTQTKSKAEEIRDAAPMSAARESGQ